MTRIALPLAAAIAALVLAGCSTESYFARRDTITPFAYNTQASNIAIQAVNPATPAAYDRRIGLDGAYGDKAVRTRLVRAATTSPGGSSDTSATGAPAEPVTGGGAIQ